MICQTCAGKGRFLYKTPDEVGSIMCPVCEGFGIIHCCEGDQEQPQTSEQTASPCPPTTLSQPTDPHAPTS